MFGYNLVFDTAGMKAYPEFVSAKQACRKRIESAAHAALFSPRVILLCHLATSTFVVRH